MRHLITWLFCVFILTGCFVNESQQANPGKEMRQQRESEMIKDKIEVNENIIQVPSIKQKNLSYFEVEDFIKKMDGSFHYEQVDRTLSMEFFGKEFYLIYGVPVLSYNGWLYPNTNNIEFMIHEDKLYLSSAFLKEVMDLELKESENYIEFVWDNPKVVTTNVKEEPSIDSAEDVLTYLAPLKNPIRNARVDTVPTHLPGATRSYRNGYHQGMDWYGYSSGVTIDRTTEIFGMGEGVVVRSDHDYVGYTSAQERNEELMLAIKSKKTPEYILDRLRGRQVWVQYDNGVQARFAHLDRINSDLQVGDRVSADTLIGYVGNSGTSGEVKQDNSELHLHLDILIHGEFFWRNLSQDEVVHVLKTVFEG